MVNQRLWNRMTLNVPKLAVTFVATVLFLIGMMIFAEKASAHGYVDTPTSRAYLCKLGVNTNCGGAQYDPHSLEAPGGFPNGGPADGQITGAGLFPQLYEQTPTRWAKVNMNGGANTFKWTLTAPHATTEWKYYITKKDWNPNKALTRADLDLQPFCYVNDGGKRPPFTVEHQCNVPTDRSGYHLILAVWEIADTGNAFYQVIDVNLNNDGSNPQLPTIPGNVTSPSKTQTSISLSWSPSTAASGIQHYEVHRDGSLIGTTNQTSYTDTGLTANTTYTYTIRAVAVNGDKSHFTAPLSVKTLGNGGSDLPEWDPNKVYVAGDRVQYNGLEYQALYWTQNQRPDQSSAWKLISQDVIQEWSSTKVYHGGDRVTYQGVTYEARWWTQGDEPGVADVWRVVN